MASDYRATIFYGWKLSFLAAFGNFMVQGGGIYLMNAFIEPFSGLYGWSRGELGTALGIGSFCGMASAPVLASLAMKVSLRLIMTLGALFGGVALFLLGRFDSLALFTLNFCVLWIAGQACGGVVANALMSNWFVKYRGRAFGIVNFGISFSGAVLPFAALVLIKLFSVQTASAILGVFLLVALFPACWLFVRDTPESMGLAPDGETPETGAGAAVKNGAEPETPPTIRELLREPLVYRIGIPFTLALLAAAGVVGQLKPRFSDLGFSDFAAMGFMCVTAFFTAVGKYFWGWICDKIPPLKAARIFFIFCAGALLLAFLPSNLFTVALFCLLSGLGMGGTWTLLPAVVVDVFGRANFMAVYRVVAVFLFFKSLGYIIMGQSYQLTGSYDAAFIFFCLLFLVGFFITPPLGSRYMKKP